MSTIGPTARLVVVIVLIVGCSAASPSVPAPSTGPVSQAPEPSTIVPTTAASPSERATSTPSATAVDPPGVLAVKLPPGVPAVTLTDSLRVRSDPRVADQATILGVLPAGTRFVIVAGPVAGSGYWWYRVAELSVAVRGGVREGWLASADHDGTPWIGPTPDACRDIDFQTGPVTVATLAELQAGFVGTWTGCVTTPWVPEYWVTIVFRGDGTYSAASQVRQAGAWQPAFYYGTDDDASAKRYELNDLQDSLDGVGEIDIVFSADSVNRGDLRNIKLMGDQLEFEFFHRGQYGPLTYRLSRFDEPD